MWQDLVARQRLRGSIASYVARFDAKVVEAYRTRAVLVPGAIRLLSALKAASLPMAVASSSRRQWVEVCLEQLGIRRYFDTIVGGDMVIEGKPDPAVFLLAARQLGVRPTECFAVEDSPKGVTAAVAAGMLTFAVRTPYTPHGCTSGAHVEVGSLEELAGLEAGARATATWRRG